MIEVNYFAQIRLTLETKFDDDPQGYFHEKCILQQKHQNTIPTAKIFPSKESKEIGFPTGASSCHRPLTPILLSYH